MSPAAAAADALVALRNVLAENDLGTVAGELAIARARVEARRLWLALGRDLDARRRSAAATTACSIARDILHGFDGGLGAAEAWARGVASGGGS